MVARLTLQVMVLEPCETSFCSANFLTGEVWILHWKQWLLTWTNMKLFLVLSVSKRWISLSLPLKITVQTIYPFWRWRKGGKYIWFTRKYTIITGFKICSLFTITKSKKYSVCIAQSTVFQKNHQNLGQRIRKLQYYNFWKFQNFVKRENCSKHLPPVQRINHLCNIDFHLFLFIGNGSGWINYSVRLNHNLMFVLIPYCPKKMWP